MNREHGSRNIACSSRGGTAEEGFEVHDYRGSGIEDRRAGCSCGGPCRARAW